jgi:hypothetical protein
VNSFFLIRWQDLHTDLIGGPVDAQLLFSAKQLWLTEITVAVENFIQHPTSFLYVKITHSNFGNLLSHARF